MASTVSPVVGTELKILVTLTVSTLDMDDYDYTLYFSGSEGTVEVPKADVVVDSDGNHYAFVDTTTTGSGVLRMKVVAYVPDSDEADDGLRTEVAYMTTGIRVYD